MFSTPGHTDNTVSGVIAIITSVVVALFVNLPPQHGDAPAWVGNACAAAFLCAGVAIIAGSRRWPPVVGQLAGLAATYLLVVPGLWVVMGGDPDRCSLGIGAGNFMLPVDPGAFLCRSVFGAGALLTLCAALVFTALAIRRSRARKPAGAAN